MQVNPNKCHLAINESCRKEIKIAGNIKKNSECGNLLGINIDSKLGFKTHVEDLCKRASRNIHALAKITRYINFPKRCILFIAFSKSQFK